jgi:cell division protein ZapA (FtsZ GTPase activity inhibitor)
MNELSISLNIAGRSYKLMIDKDHEELFRTAAKLIDKRIKEYSSSYAYKDKQDLLAMVAIEYTTSFLQKEHRSTSEVQFVEKQLEEIDTALTDLLNGNPNHVL